jgi:hypothetical protein
MAVREDRGLEPRRQAREEDAPPPSLSARDRALRRIAESRLMRPPRRAALWLTRATYYSDRTLRLGVREELPFLLNRRRLLGCGVEVGVKNGFFSEVILRDWRGCHLISVDPWREAPAEEYVDRANVDQAVQDAHYQDTVRRLQRFGDRSSIWRMTGREAARQVPHHSLDFAYLDARHDYGSVREDLDVWHDRVRPGGILAGHDYVDGFFMDGEFRVKSAVDDFFAERGLKPRATYGDPPWISWYVVLPR